jgi:hydroxypyruvate isomerase
MAMDRRQFGRALSGTALGSVLLSDVEVLHAKRHPVTAAALQVSVMLWTVYAELPFEQRLEKAAEAGYPAVELVTEYEDWSRDDFRRFNAKKRTLGISFDAMALTKTGIANPKERGEFLAELNRLLPIATELECPAIIVLSGRKIRELSHEQQHQSCVECLKRAADIASGHKVTLLLENIDPEENPQYFLTSAAEGFQIVHEVAHPNAKFLYDFYHAQIAEGNLIEKLEQHIDDLGLVHIADVPGRHAPGTGEINYSNVFRRLAELRYDGYVAMEFVPTGDAVTELKAARELVMRSSA